MSKAEETITQISAAIGSMAEFHHETVNGNDLTCIANPDAIAREVYRIARLPAPVAEDAGQMLQRLGMDGQLWAEEMHKRFPEVPEDDLLGWCCNMIMAGYDEATRRSKSHPLPPAEREEAVRVMAEQIHAKHSGWFHVEAAKCTLSKEMANTALSTLEAKGMLKGGAE